MFLMTEYKRIPSKMCKLEGTDDVNIVEKVF